MLKDQLGLVPRSLLKSSRLEDCRMYVAPPLVVLVLENAEIVQHQLVLRIVLHRLLRVYFDEERPMIVRN